MLDVTLDLPLDLKRMCQANAKVYLVDKKQFAVVTSFSDIVNVKLDQGKGSPVETYSKEEFLDKITSDGIVSKSRVASRGDSGEVAIRPRVIVAAPEYQSMDPKVLAPPQLQQFPGPSIFQPSKQESALLTAYIDEKTGKFSKTLQTGMIEIQYRKVTKKVQLELDSNQLQKLKELGIIVDE